MKKKTSRDGILIDARQWSEDDWRDLHEAIDNAIKSIASRHAKDEKEPITRDQVFRVEGMME